MADFKKEKSPTQGKGEAEVDWITVNGAHIPIKDGESPQEAVGNLSAKNLIKKSKNDTITLPAEEFAPYHSAIMTKYGGKIPKKGGVFLSNYYYRFRRENGVQKCIRKVEIVGNEDYIDFMEKKYGNKNRN